MANFTPEMIEKAKTAKSAEELLSLAKENNIEVTKEEAKAYFEQLNPASGELSDDELDTVSGGEKNFDTVPALVQCRVCGTLYPMNDTCPNCVIRHPEIRQ